ncbi:MAG: RNA polymerase sigma factor RpoE, partial [uncultured Corynebacteriales bacterium]
DLDERHPGGRAGPRPAGGVRAGVGRGAAPRRRGGLRPAGGTAHAVDAEAGGAVRAEPVGGRGRRPGNLGRPAGRAGPVRGAGHREDVVVPGAAQHRPDPRGPGAAGGADERPGRRRRRRRPDRRPGPVPASGRGRVAAALGLHAVRLAGPAGTGGPVPGDAGDRPACARGPARAPANRGGAARRRRVVGRGGVRGARIVRRQPAGPAAPGPGPDPAGDRGRPGRPPV